MIYRWKKLKTDARPQEGEIQRIMTEPYSLGSYHIFIESYWPIYGKSIISAYLFKDESNSTSNAQTFLPHVVVESESDSQLLSSMDCCYRVRTSEYETQLTPKKDNQKSHYVVASDHLEDYTNKAILRTLSVPPSLLYLCGSTSSGKPGPGNRGNQGATGLLQHASLSLAGAVLSFLVS